MTVEALKFTADDVALAIQTMTDEAQADISYVDKAQMNRDMQSAANRVSAEVSAAMQLHGITAAGDPDLGDPRAVEAIRREVESYKADPMAFIDRLDAAADAAIAEAEVVALPEPAAVTPVATPAVARVPANEFIVPPVAAPPPAVMAPKVDYVPRPIKGLFPGVSNDYATELVPTAKWKGDAKPHIGTPDPHYCFDGFQVKVMAAALRRRKNVMAVGKPGCGKTEFFKQFAARIGLPYNGITFDGQLSRAEIIGSFRQIATPEGSATPFIDGLIPTLIQRPGILCLNEVDQCDPDIQYMLHDMYEGGGLTIQEDGGRFVPRHPDCFIVATANSKGRGSENGLTHARHEMSEATRDRYPVWLNFTYLDEVKEAETIAAKTTLAHNMAESLVAIGNMIRQGYEVGEVAQPCSLRQLLDAAEFAEEFATRGPDIALALAIDLVVIGRANDDDALQISEYVKQKLAVDLTTLER